MKKIFTLIILLIVTKISLAQVPNLMNYQAVARNAQGQALANQAIKVRLSLIQLDAGGATTFYAETRSVTTNALGLFNVQVGSGGAQNVIGNINGTNWLDGSKTRSLKVEIDINNSNSFVDMGSQQLVSVPYAFAAETAKKVSAPFVGFRAQRINNFILPSATSWDIAFDGEIFDSTGVYTPATGKFKAPEDGMYYLDYKLMIYANSVGVNETITNVFFSSKRGALHNNSSGDYQRLENGGNAVSGSIITFLEKGEEVNVQLGVNQKAGSWILHSSGSTFQGYKIK